MLGIIFKMLMPFIAFYFVQKLIRQFLFGEQVPGKKGSIFSQRNKKDGSSDAEIIEICPECGNIILPSGRHRCGPNPTDS